MNPKVLIGVVTASQKDYCVEQFKEQLKSFTYDNYEVLIIDNSEDPKHKEVFKDFTTIHCSRYKENGNPKAPNQILVDCQNLIRDKFLESNCDVLMMLESDVFINKDIIQWAMSHNTDVYTVSYPIKVNRYKTPSPCIQYFHLLRHKDIKRSLSQTLMLPPHIHFEAVCKPIIDFRISDRMTLTHTGLGCTFISKAVVNAIPFRIDENNDRATGGHTFSDTFFYTDCLIKKVEVLLENRMICKHIKNW